MLLNEMSLLSDAKMHLDEPVYTSEGVPVNDVMKYFVGDHPAQQFERGTEVGGNYKCGGCGCRSQLMDDQAHALRCTVRSLQDIQSIALDGVFGKVPKSIKPLYLPDLSINEIRKELKIYLIVFSVCYNTIQKLINSALFFSRSAGVCMHVGLSTAMLITIILSLQEQLLRPEGILLI